MKNLIIMATQLSWQQWIYGLLNAAVGGAATAGVAWTGMASARSAGIDLPILNWKALGVILLSGSLSNLFFYLKQSPLPFMTITSERKTTVVTTESSTLPKENL